MLKLDLQYFAEGVEIEYEGETSNLPIGKQARFACKDKSMPSDIIIKNNGFSGDLSKVTATRDKVLEGELFYGTSGLEEGTMPNNGYIDGDYGATLDIKYPQLLLNGAYRGSVSIYPQEVTIVPSDNDQEISPAEGRVFGKIKVEKIPPAEEWDGTGVVITPITPEASPSITINGATYNVVQGMTWFTWASNEEYNTDNFQCLTVDSKVFVAEREDYVVDSDGNAVYGEDLITVGGVYSIEEVSTTDELAGTWLLNAELTPPDSSIDFLVNGTFYTYYDGAYNYYDLKAIWLRIGSLSRNTTIYLRNPADGNTLGAYNGYYPYGRISFADSQVYTNITSDGGIRIRTFTITSNLSEVTNGDELLTWLKANATKQGDTNEGGTND